MKATYRITESDYVNAMKLCANYSPRLLVILSIIILSLLLLLVFGPPFVKIIAISGLVGGFCGFTIQRYIYIPIISRRHYRKYKLIHEEFMIELLDDGIQSSSPNGNGKITWDKMLKWRHNEKYILVYPMPRLFYVVPKSIELSGFDVPLLISRLTQHVGKSTYTPFRRTPPKKSV